MLSAADPRRAAADILAFYRDAGVEDALNETPHDRFADDSSLLAPPTERARAESPAQTPARRPLPSRDSAPAASSRPASPPPASPDAAVADARTRAASAATLDELRALMETFDGCELKRTAYQLAFGDGNPKARLMFVGEAPGAEEDRQGKPFVGRAGQLLDRMLAAIGLDRSQVYIANIIPWRPPGNRDPSPAEISVCQPFITRQIELVDPDVLVSIGRFSAQTLLGMRDGILKSRGRWLTYRVGDKEIRAMATLHPAYLLRSPAQKKLAWRDFKLIRKELAQRA